MNRRHPWLKWYPSDSRADPKLRICSLAARGLWFDLIGLMHEAEPYGHLVISGKAPTSKQLGLLLGASQREVEFLLDELEIGGVFSRDPNGIIYSRRLVRDRRKADEGRDWASKRWGKPDNPRADPIGEPTTALNAQRPETRIQTPESSSLRSDDSALLPDEISEAIKAWNALASENGLPIVQRLTPLRRSKLRARLRECGGIDGWQTALTKLKKITWMHGDNERNWKANFDFLLQESSFTKLMEGAYDRSHANGGVGKPKSTNGFASLIVKGLHRDEG